MSELEPVLAGCRVLVTAQRRADELAGALVRRGAEVVAAAPLGVVPRVDEAGLLAATRTIITDPLDVLVVTTGVGFRGWMETAGTAGLAEDLVDALRRVRLVARGPKARGALQAAGLQVDWMAGSETSAEVADFLLAEGVAGLRIAVQRHGAGDDGLHDRLTGGGASVLELEVYRWGPAPDPALLEETAVDLAGGGYDAVAFTSAPGASAWLAELRRLDCLAGALAIAEAGRLLVAGVGPVTAEPLQVAGFEVVVPHRWRMGALVRLLVTELGDRPGVQTPAGVLRVRARAATLDHRVLPLTPAELPVLRRLSLRPGEAVSREQLRSVLPDDVADPRALESAVAAVEDALGAPGLVQIVEGGLALGPVPAGRD